MGIHMSAAAAEVNRCVLQLAVCCTELWTEGRKCLHDRQLALGICLGAVIMGITLLLGV